MHWKRSNPNYNCNRRDTVALKVSCNKNVKFKIFKIRTCCRYTGYFTTAKLNLGRTEPLLARGSDIAGLNALYQGCSTFLLLPAALLLFIWDTAANEFELYLWDTTKCQPTQNTFIISKIFAYSFCNSLWHHSDCYASCRLILFLPCVCFASIYASTAAKSYILNCVWTAANFIYRRPHVAVRPQVVHRCFIWIKSSSNYKHSSQAWILQQLRWLLMSMPKKVHFDCNCK